MSSKTDFRFILASLSLLILGYIVYKVFLYPYFLSPLRSIPGPPLGNPILGQLLTLNGSEIGVAHSAWFKQYGPVVRIMAPIGVERLLILDNDIAAEVLVKDWKSFPRGQYLNELLELVSGRGLLTLHGDEHQAVRKAMQPAFALSNIFSQSDMYHAPIEGFMKLLQKKVEDCPDGVVHMYDHLSRVTLDILCETAFGYRTNSVNDSSNELAGAYENILRIQTGANLAVFYLIAHIPGGLSMLSSDWSYSHRKWYRRVGRYINVFDDVATLLESMHTVRRIAREMLSEKISEASGIEGKATKKDIMSLIVQAREDDADFAMSEDGMMDQVLTFLIGGHETISSGLSWTLFLLATHPSSQDALRREILTAFGSGKPDYKHLKSLPLLDAVVNESIRLMSPIPIISRMASETCVLRGVTVPKGTIMHICIRNMNTSGHLWGDDAEIFRPERWLSLPDSYDPTFSRITFSTGPRSCIGKNMALLEMKAILVSLLTRFEFSPAYEGQTPKADHIISYKPVDGLPLRLREIHLSPSESAKTA